MKRKFKLSALLLLAATSVFAAAPVKTIDPKHPSTKEVITFSTLPSLTGVDIKVEGSAPAKAIVMIYDQDQNVIYKDALPAYREMEKGYVLNQLESGDYTIEVTAGKEVAKKEVHVYEEDLRRVFL